MTLDATLQLLLAVTSLAAIAMATSRRPRVVRWGGIVGLLSQPLWLWSTWQAMQVGMFAVSFVYIGIWARVAWREAA